MEHVDRRKRNELPGDDYIKIKHVSRQRALQWRDEILGDGANEVVCCFTSEYTHFYRYRGNYRVQIESWEEREQDKFTIELRKME